MNYEKIYFQLVESCRVRGLDKTKYEGYFELHHIVPRCMGGGDSKDNLVMFTGREHFIAHMLLWKAYPEERGLSIAAMLMSNRFVSKVNSRLYASLREKAGVAISEKTSGKRVKDLTGLKFSKLTVVSFADFHFSTSGSKQATWNCECDCGGSIVVSGGSLTSKNTRSCGCLHAEAVKANSGEGNPMFGRKHTEETREKFKLRKIRRGKENPMFGRKMSEDTKNKIREASLGRVWSEQQRANRMKTMRYGEDHHMFGNTHSPEVRKQISETLKAKDQRPWENLSTQTEESMLKWSMCDYYYNLWIMFDKPGLKVFTKIYNETHNDNVSLSFFTNPRLKWLSGWIPQEDEKWIKFSKGMR